MAHAPETPKSSAHDVRLSAASTLSTPPPGGATETASTGSSEDLPPRVGPFHIDGEIARGGMGIVLRGQDGDFGRTLAVKLLLARHRANAELARRFVDEAQITGQLQHPGVPPVHTIGKHDDGRPFFTMKLIKGRTLAELLKERPGPADNLAHFLSIFARICQTMAYAHSRGIIHRDLKPHNIMVGAFGEVQVMDWGLAKVLGSEPTGDSPLAAEDASTVYSGRLASEDFSTRAGSVLGTPAYMAPEQARGQVQQLDERCDVFGLGAILCVLLTGQAPFVAPNREDIHDQAMRGDLAGAFARLDGVGVDAELAALTRKCLAPRRDDRPRNAGEVADAVTSYQAGAEQRLRAAETERAAAQVQAREERRRRKLVVAFAAALIGLLLVGGGAAWWLKQQQADLRAAMEKQDVLASTDLFNQGVLLNGNKRFDEAIAALNKSLQLRPDNPFTYYNLGVSYQHLGRLDDAIAQYRKALDLKLENAPLYNNLAGALLDKGDLEGAVTAGRKAVALDPQSSSAHNTLGKAYSRRGELDKAIASYTRALEADPANAMALSNFGSALGRKGDMDGAIDKLQQAIKIKPEYAMAHSNLGAALLGKKRVDAAITALRQATNLDPNYANGHFNLGTALIDKGEWLEAVAAFRRAVELNPKNGTLQHNLGAALEQTGQYLEAVKVLTTALSLRPADWLTNEALVNAHLHIGDIAGAVEKARERAKLVPTDERARQQREYVEEVHALERELPAFLKGERKPRSAVESLKLVDVCFFKKHPRAAARYFEQVPDGPKGITADAGRERTFKAIRGAVLAAAGQGQDAADLDAAERSRWRKQALAWLKAEFDSWVRVIEEGKAGQRREARKVLRLWQVHPDLASVRDLGALAKLPDDERVSWRQFWRDVAGDVYAMDEQAASER